MSFKLNVVEIRTLLFEVAGDNYDAAQVRLKEALSESDDPAATATEDIKCLEDSGIIQLISPNDTTGVPAPPMLPETMDSRWITGQSTNESPAKLAVKFYDRRCLLFWEPAEHGAPNRIWDISFEPYIELLNKRDMTEADILKPLKNEVNSFCTKISDYGFLINPTMVDDTAEMIFRVIERTTATGAFAADLSSLFFDGHFVLFMRDKYVNIGLKDIYYDDYAALLEDPALNADDILEVILNDILDFVSQFEVGEDLFDSAKFKKVQDIMDIVKFQLFR